MHGNALIFYSFVMNDPTTARKPESEPKSRSVDDPGKLYTTSIRFYNYQFENIARFNADFPEAHIELSELARKAVNFYLPIYRARVEAEERQQQKAMVMAKEAARRQRRK